MGGAGRHGEGRGDKGAGRAGQIRTGCAMGGVGRHWGQERGARRGEERRGLGGAGQTSDLGVAG